MIEKTFVLTVVGIWLLLFLFNIICSTYMEVKTRGYIRLGDFFYCLGMSFFMAPFITFLCIYHLIDWDRHLFEKKSKIP